MEKSGVVPVPVLKRKCLEEEPDGGYEGERLKYDVAALCCHQVVPLTGNIYTLVKRQWKSKTGLFDNANCEATSEHGQTLKCLSCKTLIKLNLSDINDVKRSSSENLCLFTTPNYICVKIG